VVAEEGIFVWGRNEWGQLGVGHTTDQISPIKLESLDPHDIVNISCGYRHTLAVTRGGELWSWGRNEYGELGLGDSGKGNKREKPERVLGSLVHERVSLVAAGEVLQGFSVAVTEDGRLFSWGDNSSGQLGHGDSLKRCSPSEIKFNFSEKIVQISAGYGHAIALTEQGNVWVWGLNNHGQLGVDGGRGNKTIPTKLELSEKIISVACGGWFSGALSQSGELYLWGDNEDGQLGRGKDDSDPRSPQKITFSEKIVSFSCGGYHVLALTEKGNLFSWGRNDFGQTGQGVQEEAIIEPREIPFDFKGQISGIASGCLHSLVFTDSGNIFSFGYNQYG
jgi:alpha-tubulin suppressor-like RCC1 family protein